MEPSDDGLGCLEVLDNGASNDVNQPSTFYSRRSKCVEVDSTYQFTRDRERRNLIC